MITKLPIKLADLLRQRTVEGDRIEYKAGWNPDANGQPAFPPVGISANQLDKIQRELLGHCNLIQPPYFPMLSVEVFS